MSEVIEKESQVKVGMVSLGCAKTLVDSELTLGILEKNDYKIVNDVEDCDVAIVNTCAFIHEARAESIDQIVQLTALKEQGKIKKLVVLGCLPQKYHHELESELPEVDAFVGSGDYPRIAEIIKEVQAGKKVVEVGKPLYLYDAEAPRFSLTPSHYKYVKISEGCNHKCSFCIIPQLKGLHRSRPIHDVVEEAKRQSREGAKELILTGQDTTFYGKDFENKLLLPELLKELNAIDDVAWIRLLYAYPVHLSDRILETIASSDKICNYIDVPLQHISSRMLERMNRHVDKEFVHNLVKRIRTIIPEVAIRTTFIVGFPGETEDDFNQLMDFVKEAKFERLGVFTYSYEEFSTSSKLEGHIDEEIKKERLHRLMSLQQEISEQENKRFIGKTFSVMIEGLAPKGKPGYVGRTYMDAPDVDGSTYVETPESLILKPGDIVQCQITDSYEYDLTGTFLNNK